MRSVNFTEKESVESLFRGSIYQNTHLGWLELWDLHEANGSVWLDTGRKSNYLIGLQPVNNSIIWLHSFYSDIAPGEYPLAQKIRELLSPGRHSVYTISSHSWYNKLLEKNNFHSYDEIIEMESTALNIPAHNASDQTFEFCEDLSEEIILQYETIFPPIWRLNPAESNCALRTSSYKLAIMENHQIIGCLLADFADDNCHIQRLVVSPEFQNRGAATAMIRKMVSDAKENGVRSFSVNTNRNNSNAVHFYEQLNFRIQGKQYPVYYRYI